MKVKDIKSMDDNEIKAKIADLEKELSIEYGTRSSAAGKSRNYGKIRTIKRTIARMKTFLRARDLGIMQKEIKPANKS